MTKGTAIKKKKIGLLVFPPGNCPTTPYSSLPLLGGLLKSAGFTVDVRDLNAEAYNYWFELLENQLPEALFPKARFPKKKSEKVSEALSFFRGLHGDFFSAQQYSQYRDTLVHAIYELSSYFKSSALSIAGYSKYGLDLKCSDLVFDLENGIDPLLLFVNRYLNKTDFIHYSWIGISVPFSHQIESAITFSIWLRKSGYKNRIVLGGACVNLLRDFFRENRDVFNYIDMIILDEGESAILKIAENSMIPADQVPGTLYRDNNGRIVITEQCDPVDLNPYVPPDYSLLPTGLYLSPSTTIVTTTGRGCYYNRCAFCVSSFQFSSRRERSTADVINELGNLSRETSSKVVFFADDCIPPKYLLELAESMIHFKTNLFWQCEMRFDSDLDYNTLKTLKKSGCVQLIFGLESASQKILNKMCKGTKLKVIDEIVTNCLKVGINVNLQTMIGFPGERVDEAVLTYDYLKNVCDSADSFSMGSFQLLKNSAVFNNPSAFGITILPENEFGGIYSYELQEGLNLKESSALSTSFYKQHLKRYPVNEFFLDGPMGNHALLYATKGKLKEIIKQSLSE